MRYSILINSCDAYSDAWPMFFFLLKKMWVGHFPKIYLNTELKSYNDSSISINIINSPTDIMWGERLINALNSIEEDYVLMLLEDFYFESSINTEIIETCIDEMEKNKNILSFQLTPNGEYDVENSYVVKETVLGKFGKRKQFGLYTIAAGPTIWRKSDLKLLTRKNDSPWEWEFFGSHRTWLYGKKIYCWNDKSKKIFDYDVEHGGAIHRGKWVGYKMDELTKKFNYDLNYGKREIEYDWMKDVESNKICPFYFRLNTIIKNRIKIISNVLYGLKVRGKY